MNLNFLIGALEMANLFITLFILYFAFLFLMKSHRHHDRRPWEFLIAALIVFFITEILGVVYVINENPVIPVFRVFLQTIFAAIILLAFTHQHHLIHHQEEIKIHKKERA